MDHGWTSRPSNKGDYTNHSSRYTQGLKCLRYTHYSEQKTLCPLRARGGGQDLNGQNPLSGTKISYDGPLRNKEHVLKTKIKKVGGCLIDRNCKIRETFLR